MIIPLFIQFYTSQVVQDFFHQPYVNPSSLVGPQWTTKQLTSCEIHRRWISTFLNLRSRLLSSDMLKCFKQKKHQLQQVFNNLVTFVTFCDYDETQTHIKLSIDWLWFASGDTVLSPMVYFVFHYLPSNTYCKPALKPTIPTAVGFCHRWPTTEQNQNHVNHSQLYGWSEISSYTFPVR